MSFEKKRKRKAPQIPVTTETRPGTPVMSRTGRDRGRVYTVSGMQSDKHGSSFAILVGGGRTKERPKRKNIRQLEVYTDTDGSTQHTDTEEKANV